MNVLSFCVLRSPLHVCAEIVSIDVAVPQPENPWLKMAGRFKDDPHFDEMLADIETYRRDLDVEMEHRFQEPDEQV